MAFNPYDPTGGPMYGAERYIEEYMKRMYYDLRQEIHRELSMSRPMYAPVDDGKPRVTAHQGKKLTAGMVASAMSEKPRMVVDRVPDGIIPLVAYRAWRVVELEDGTHRLRALGKDENWEPKKATAARCLASKSHPAPNMECTCGVWAFESTDKLLKACASYSPSVFGPVSLWGRIIECENGFRAQYAYPKELWLLDTALEFLGKAYGVPIRVAATV